MIHDVASSHPFFHVREVIAVDLVKLNTGWHVVQLAADHVVNPDNLVPIGQHCVCEVAT
jgi:hypothetical protein